MLFCIAPCGADVGSTRAARQGFVSLQDFFFYHCVHAYMRLHKVPQFDNSHSYATEYVEAPVQMLINLSEAAKEAAKSLPSPDYSDPEHGSPAVLAFCKERAYGQDVARTISEAGN